MPNAKVKVPQKDGEIVVRHGNNEPVTYRVSDGEVSVKSEDLAHFIAVVDGAHEIAGGTPAAKKES